MHCFAMAKPVIMNLRVRVYIFCRNHVLEISGGMDEMGMVRWQLFLCLMGAWTIVFLCLSKGVKSFGKVCVTTLASRVYDGLIFKLTI